MSRRAKRAGRPCQVQVQAATSAHHGPGLPAHACPLRRSCCSAVACAGGGGQPWGQLFAAQLQAGPAGGVRRGSTSCPPPWPPLPARRAASPAPAHGSSRRQRQPPPAAQAGTSKRPGDPLPMSSCPACCGGNVQPWLKGASRGHLASILRQTPKQKGPPEGLALQGAETPAPRVSGPLASLLSRSFPCFCSARCWLTRSQPSQSTEVFHPSRSPLRTARLSELQQCKAPSAHACVCTCTLL